MKIYLVSDTHLGHHREIDFGRPEGYEKQIIKGLRKLRRNELLLHLGDVCFGKEALWHEIIESLKCRKILVRGNHDRKSDNWYLNHGWDFVCNEFAMNCWGKSVLFSHIPQLYDREKYDLNIHGHLHDHRHQGSSEDFFFDDRVYKLVSMEFLDYQPVSLGDFLFDKCVKYEHNELIHPDLGILGATLS